MSTTLSSLTARVQRLIGDTDPDNPRWGSNDVMNALADSLEDFNSEIRIGTQYEILSTGNSRYYNPDPTDMHKNILCCYAGLILLNMERFKAAREAINYSNSAGSTNLTYLPEAIDRAVSALLKKLDGLTSGELRQLAEDDMSVTELTSQE
ncbi:MAG: hypothetical protein WC479_06165 [Candidatus Izemoplasmatales bacterium]